MKHLYFVRHGRTEWNATARMQGQWNSDLDAVGVQQAAISGRLLAGLSIEAMFVSPLDRTRQTAAIINEYLALPITLDDRLKEWDCGDWSGFLYSEIAERWPTEWAAWRADLFNYRGPNCENYPDMIARAAPFLDELLRHPARSIAIVSHGMIGRAMIATLLGLDVTQTLALHQPNDRIYALRLMPGGAEVMHYEGANGPFPGVASPAAASQRVESA